MEVKRIILVIGKVCSGKDTFAKQHLNHIQIDIGSLVRELSQTISRTHDKSLDVRIIDRLGECLSNGNYIITGIRQLSILNKLISQYSEEIEMIYLNVPLEELKRRFITRAAEKDSKYTFEEVLQRDADLGLAEIEDFIEANTSLFTIINNN